MPHRRDAVQYISVGRDGPPRRRVPTSQPSPAATSPLYPEPCTACTACRPDGQQGHSPAVDVKAGRGKY